VMKSFRLLGNRPNPFSLETRIAFELPRPGHVALEIFSVNGRLIRTLLKENLAPGGHEIVWDGRDDGGRKVAGGTYFYRLSAPGVAQGRRLIVLP
jgi:flagellar hook assembly protein FlgD